MKKILLSIVWICGSLSALEFGYMGNTAFGMGGSGVAVPNNPFSAYYNPSLLGVDGSIRVGYSLGVRLKEDKLSQLSKITLSSINDIDALNRILEHNSISMTSENGIAVQIPLVMGSTFSHSLGIGIFYTKRGTINFTGSLNTGTTSIESANNAYIITNGLDIVELPLSYATQIYSNIGSFYVGASLKYIYAKHNFTRSKFGADTQISDSINQVFSTSGGLATNTFGLDVGASYALPNDVFIVGIVAKNLNSPTINTMNAGAVGIFDNLRLDSQYRLGMATRAIPFTTLALDFDLRANEEFKGLNNGMSKDKVQYISLGGMLNIGIFDVKLGLAKNILNGHEGWLVSAGLGFTFIDISFFSNLNTAKINSVKMPTEYGVKLGGGFSF